MTIVDKLTWQDMDRSLVCWPQQATKMFVCALIHCSSNCAFFLQAPHRTWILTKWNTYNWKKSDKWMAHPQRWSSWNCSIFSKLHGMDIKKRGGRWGREFSIFSNLKFILLTSTRDFCGKNVPNSLYFSYKIKWSRQVSTKKNSNKWMVRRLSIAQLLCTLGTTPPIRRVRERSISQIKE